MTAVRARLIEWGKEEDGGEEEWLEEVLGLVLFKIIPSSAFFSRMEMILKSFLEGAFHSMAWIPFGDHPLKLEQYRED